MQQRPLRVLVVDDHTVVRRGLRAYLDTVDDMEVVGEAADGQEALEEIAVLVAAGRPADAVLVAPKPQTADSLTDREREVLALVANGLSNLQIADSLVISERTARTHVSNILGKLGVASRTQAALLAIREGVVPVSPESFDSGGARRYGS
jgi:DNA-binding NarL/FixJ family response regulator